MDCAGTQTPAAADSRAEKHFASAFTFETQHWDVHDATHKIPGLFGSMDAVTTSAQRDTSRLPSACRTERLARQFWQGVPRTPSSSLVVLAHIAMASPARHCAWNAWNAQSRSWCLAYLAGWMRASYPNCGQRSSRHARRGSGSDHRARCLGRDNARGPCTGFGETGYLRSMSDAQNRPEARVATVVDYWIEDALVRAMTMARIEARVDPRIRARLVAMTDAITIGRIEEWMTDERVAGRIRELLHDRVDARIDERIDARIVAMSAPVMELAGDAVTDERIDHWIDDALISARVRSQISSRIEDLIDYRSRALIRSRVHLDPEDG